MFWKKKPKTETPAESKAEPEVTGKMTREQIIAKATATAAAKREEIGNETLDAIREAITRRQNSPAEKAKQIIKSMDDSVVRTHLSELLKEEKNKLN
jgi:hypothetical protein